MKTSTQFMPAIASTRFAHFALGVGVSTVAIAISSLLLPQPTWAQYSGSQPLEEFKTPQSEQDSFSGQIGSGGFNVFDLMHNAQLGTRDVNEVINEQRESWNINAQEFRCRQLQQMGNPLLQQSCNVQQEAPTNSPATSPTGY